MKLVDLINQRKERERREKAIDNAKKIAAGSIIGAVAGVLLAPKSGKETRKDIADKAIETKDATKNTIKDSAYAIKEAKGKISEDVKNKLDEFKDREMFEVEINKEEVDEKDEDNVDSIDNKEE